MDAFTFVVNLLSWALTVFATWNVIGVFYDKRRTSFSTAASTWLLLYIAPTLTFHLLGIPIVNVATNVIALFIITLNYESSFARRLAASSSCILLLILAEFIASAIVGIYQISVFVYLGENVTAFTFIITGVFSYTIAIAFRRFKNIKKIRLLGQYFGFLYLLFLSRQ